MRRLWLVVVFLGGCSTIEYVNNPTPPDLAYPLAPAPDGGEDAAESASIARHGTAPHLPFINSPKPIPGVMVTTLAGSDRPGSQDGPGADARFKNPVGIARAPDGTLYVTEYDGSRVRHVTPDGTTSTVVSQRGFVQPFAVTAAGGGLVVQTDCDPSGKKGASTGTIWQVPLDGNPAVPVVSGLGRPRALAPYGSELVAVADRTLEQVWILELQNEKTQTVLDSSQLGHPIAVAVLPDQSLVIADADNHRLRRLTPDGELQPFAGDGIPGIVDGAAEIARFDRPIALATDRAGNVYVSDQGRSHRVRRVINGNVETLAGSAEGFADGDGATAEFYGQEGIAVEPDGSIVYLADGNGGDESDHNRIREILLP